MRYRGRLSQWARAILSGTLVLGLISLSTSPASAQETILTIERSVPQGYYLPDQTLDVAVTFNREGTAQVTALALYETLPSGWTYDSYVSGPSPIIAPAPGTSGMLEFVYLTVAAFPATFVYRVNVPVDENGTQVLSGYAEYRLGGGAILTPLVETPIPEENQPPVANGDAYAVSEDETLTVPAPGVLANDTDPDGDALTALLVDGVSYGALTFSPDGSFQYVPDSNFFGIDSFTYKASDEPGQTGTGGDTLPDPGGDGRFDASDVQMVINEALGVQGARGDINRDGCVNAVDIQLIIEAVLAGRAPLKNLQYEGFPLAKLDSEIVTVTITVAPLNDVPGAASDAYTVAEDQTLTVTAPGVLGNDSDPDGDALTAMLVSGVSHGVLTLNADGSFSYVPAANYSGSDSFTYLANDGELDSSIATVSITVTPVNDRPVAANDSYTVSEDQALTVAAPGVLGNDSDPDGNVLTAVLLTGVSHGTLTLNPNGSFSYTPAADYSGPDSFRYVASDQIVVSLAATVSITITPAGEQPVGIDDAYTVAEDQTLAVTAPGVLGNDTDEDGDALMAVLVSGPGQGTLTFNADGSFVYQPEANYNGQDSFTYRANDGALDSNEATVTITVTPVNDAPVADAGDDQINALTGRTITLDGSDSYDVDGDLIAYEWRFESLPPASALTDNDIAGWDTASPSFIPDVAGDFVLSLVVRDYEFDSDPDYVMVSADAQAAPNADAGGNQETLLGEVVMLDGCSSYDPDNGPEPLTYAWSFFSVAAGSTLTDNDIVDRTECSASFMPDMAGVYELMLTVSDGFESDIAVAVITVTELENVPPVADAGADQTVAYGAAAYLDGSGSYDPDSGPQPLSFMWSFVSLPALSGLTNDDISGRTTALPWFTPDVVGSYVLQLEVTDGEDTSADNVEVTCMEELSFQDVTGRVSMSTANESVYMMDPIKRMMISAADLTITNISADAIEAPMQAVFVISAAGVDMPEASGTTQNGDFYYDLEDKAGITELLPGQSVTIRIELVFHYTIRFTYAVEVWAMAP